MDQYYWHITGHAHKVADEDLHLEDNEQTATLLTTGEPYRRTQVSIERIEWNLYQLKYQREDKTTVATLHKSQYYARKKLQKLQEEGIVSTEG